MVRPNETHKIVVCIGVSEICCTESIVRIANCGDSIIKMICRGYVRLIYGRNT